MFRWFSDWNYMGITWGYRREYNVKPISGLYCNSTVPLLRLDTHFELRYSSSKFILKGDPGANF